MINSRFLDEFNNMKIRSYKWNFFVSFYFHAVFYEPTSIPSWKHFKEDIVNLKKLLQLHMFKILFVFK